MVNDLVWLVGRVNLVLAAAIVVVLLLRMPARRLFGARVAYALWLMPLLAAAMCFAPARVIHVFVSPPTSSATAVVPHNEPWLFFLWAGGALISLAVLAQRQIRGARPGGHRRPASRDRDAVGFRSTLRCRRTTHRARPRARPPRPRRSLDQCGGGRDAVPQLVQPIR